MMDKLTKKLLTKKGHQKLKNELDELQEKRPEMVERMEQARQKGDLRENSEYHSAKEDLVFLENRINEIKAILSNAEIVQPNGKEKKEINLGSQVTVQQDDNKITYEVVGEHESDPMAKKISYSSPLGQALMGKKKGQKVTAKTPRGEINYKIVAIK